MAETLWSPTLGDVNFPWMGPTGLGYLTVGTGVRTATAVAGAATLNKPSGVITTEALNTAAGAEYILTLTNSGIAFQDQVYASVGFVSANAGTPCITRTQGGAGNVVIHVQNVHATAAFNGTLEINFLVVKS
jgi:hypothetical protein